MLSIIRAPADAALAKRLESDLQVANYVMTSRLSRGREHVLIVVLSADALNDQQVENSIHAALDNGNYIIPVLAAPMALPKLIDHLPALDFSGEYDFKALQQRLAELTTPGARLPLKVRTPSVEAANRRVGLVVALIALIMFLLGLYMVGVMGIQAPAEEYNAIDTEAAITVQALIEHNLPHSTQEATNFPSTVQAAPRAQREPLSATATARAGK